MVLFIKYFISFYFFWMASYWCLLSSVLFYSFLSLSTLLLSTIRAADSLHSHRSLVLLSVSSEQNNNTETGQTGLIEMNLIEDAAGDTTTKTTISVAIN